MKLGWAGKVALVAALPVLVGLGAFVIVALDSVHGDAAARLEGDLIAQARGFAHLFGDETPEVLHRRIDTIGDRLGMRVTIIDAGGRVLADSESDPRDMDNHAGRPEVAAAKRDGTAVRRRFSHTVRRELLYAAARTAGSGRVVRLARDVSAIRRAREAQARTFWLVALGVLVVTLPLAVWFARRLARPVLDLTRVAERIEGGDFDARIGSTRADEIGQLGEAFDRMTSRLAAALRTAEAETMRLTTVLEGMTEGVVAIDARERVSFLNGAAREILLVQGSATPVAPGTPFVELVREPRILGAVQAAVSHRRVVEAEVSHEGPPRRLVQIYVAPTAGGDGEGVILVLRDLSRLRRLEQMRTDFVSNVSHELRTPLASIAAAVETLADEAVRVDTQDGPRFVAMIERNVRRLEALLQDILALSRMESRPETLPRDRVDFAAVARSAVEELRPRADQAGIELTCHAPGPAVVHGDQATLRRVVDNLVVNAITYTAEGGVSVELAVGEGQARLRVTDTGIGIPQSCLDRVFERFYRVDKARSRSAGGTGLGLAIVKHAVGLHGGTIEVESETGRGSVFTVTLPLRPEEGPER